MIKYFELLLHLIPATKLGNIHPLIDLSMHHDGIVTYNR